MKHSRGEIVKCIVVSYIKKRQYGDNDNVKKAEQPLSRTAETSRTCGIVDMESSYPNSIMYKCVSNDPTVAEAQFSSLKTWIHDLECAKTSEELKILLFPMLCHLYIEMLTGGHKTAASAFLIKHQSLSSEEGFELLEELATVESTKEISEKKVLSCLRSSKYQVALSSDSIQILKQYLVRKSHIILLQIVNSWFDLEEAAPEADLQDLSDDPTPLQANGFEDHQKLTADNDLAKIEEIIRLVNEGPTSPSPFLLYSVLNSDECMSCGLVSDDNFLLAAGYANAEVRLWSLKDDVLPKQRLCPGSRVRLAVDTENPMELEEAEDHADEMNANEDGVFRNNDSIALAGHSATVQDAAFLSGSEFLVSVSMDKTMRAWNLTTHSCVAVYRGHSYPIWCVNASPLAGFVATGSHDRTARLWSLELNFPLRVFAGHQQDVDCLSFHPNGNYLSTGSSDNSVRLWSVDSGQLVRVLDGHHAGVMALVFSPDGNQIASAGDDKRIKVWDLRNSSVVGEFRGHTDTILSLSWSPNGDYLASCSMDNTARLWSVKATANDEESVDPKIYSLTCNSVCSIKYSAKNTPMCVVGVK